SDYDNNIITIGTAAENSLIRALNEDMNVPFDETGTAFETRDKMELLSEFSQRVGSAQLFASPLREGRMMFVITGVDDNHISYVVKYLSDLELLAKLTGDTAFV
ncbi:cellulose biosynthesis cyclic di-GMP-binding regulatory protein BcsB, partial [Aduncisulcus paluster]